MTLDLAPTRPSIRAAQVALAWVVVFTAFHVYWYLGGSFASPGTLPDAPHSLVRWAFDVFVGSAFVAGVRTGNTGLTTKETTGAAHLTWSGWAIDGYFVVGGFIFTWLAVRRSPNRLG